MPTQAIAAYFRQLREGRGFTQETLAHAVGVAKRTIERLERNEGDISVQPFERMIVLLGALPDEVNYLATNPSATVEEARELARLLLQRGPSLDRSAADLSLHREDPSTKGVQTYIRVLRERQGLSRKALADVIGIAIGVLADWEIGRTSAIPPQALVRAVTHLGATLEDLEQIATASDDHEVLGRRLAEERIIAAQVCQASANGRSGPCSNPSFERLIMRRMAALEGLSHFIIGVLKRAMPNEAKDIERSAALWYQTAIGDEDAGGTF